MACAVAAAWWVQQEALEAREAAGDAAASTVCRPLLRGILARCRPFNKRCPPELPSLLSSLPFFCSSLQLESENSKLRYQALHLKRAVAESDEKLAALQASK